MRIACLFVAALALSLPLSAEAAVHCGSHAHYVRGHRDAHGHYVRGRCLRDVRHDHGGR